MRHVFKLKSFVPVASLLLLSACSLVPEQPNYEAMVEREKQQIATWTQQENAKASTSLNQLINSDALNALLVEANKANPSLQQALLTLKIRRTQTKQVRANQLPEVEAGFSASKVEDTSASYTGSLLVSWELDLWQKLESNSTAASLDAEQQLALFQSTRDSLGADVIKIWLGLISQQQTIEIEQQRLYTLLKNEQFILQRYKNGLGTLEDLDSARSNVASAKASIEVANENLVQQQRAMNTLLGRTQQLTFDIAKVYPAVILPLADMPEQTLQRRPDLRSAYLAIKAEALRTEVAYKDMLPSINLSSALSDIASSPTSALLNDPIWSLLAQLAAPIYKGGRLKAAAEISELETAYQYQVFRETLLTAVNEVENALGQEKSLTIQQQQIATALNSARNTLKQYQSSYRTGLVDILDLLNVQQKTYDLEAQLNRVTYNRLYNRVDLGLALGLPIDMELKG